MNAETPKQDGSQPFAGAAGSDFQGFMADVFGSAAEMRAAEPKDEDPYRSEDYQRFVESMVPHCRCAERYRPCDGVLAGGLCDRMTDEMASDSMDVEDE